MNRIVLADNLAFLKTLPDASIDLIYIDPPFNTGKTQVRTRTKAHRSLNGNQVGFKGQTYATEYLGETSFPDTFLDYEGFLGPRLKEAHRVLKRTGSFYLHVDPREVHYCKVLLDTIFGRDNFINEVIWAWDYGGKPKDRWPAKHNNILFYGKTADRYWDLKQVERIPYMAPGLVTPEKAERGKLVTDVFWLTIVSPTGKEKTGYATQKPLTLLNRLIAPACPKGGTVLDFFAGSGTTLEAAYSQDMHFIGVDSNPEAIGVMRRRFAGFANVRFEPEESVEVSLSGP